jgi:hypothetical protein
MKTVARPALVMIPVLAFVLGSVATGCTGSPPAHGVVADDPLGTLPPALREQGRGVLAERDDRKRADLAEALAETDRAATLEFMLALLEADPSPIVRTQVIDELEGRTGENVRRGLERAVEHDPDPGVAVEALELLRVQTTELLLARLNARLARLRATGDGVELQRLAREQERWASIVRGALLPTFLQTPPPVFVATAKPRVRVLAFGDYGDGSAEQRRVAAAMRRYHRRRPFDFGITLGDNFYPRGMESPTDARWGTWWSALYDPLRIRFYAALGNHDWGQPNSPAAEILYTGRSPSWRMPAAYYTFTAGPAQFFALDTDVLSEPQLRWLADELDRSTAVWKVVYGHHPIYSEGVHEDNNQKIEQLLPVLRDRADVYLAGHDHDMQHLKPEGRLHFFVAGSGGKLRPIESGPRSLFAKSAHGFAVLEIDAATLQVAFVDTALTELYRHSVRRSSTVTVP